MSPVFVLLLLGSVGVIGFLAICRLAARQSVAARAHAGELAERLGVRVLEGKPGLFGLMPPPELTGSYRGRALRCHQYHTGSGKSRRTWSAIEVGAVRSGGLKLEIGPQGFTSRVASLFGVKEAVVGDPAFDARWFIQTNQPAFVRAALIPEIQAVISDLDARQLLQAPLRIDDGKVSYRESGTLGHPARCARFAAVAPLLVDLAAIADVWGDATPSA